MAGRSRERPLCQRHIPASKGLTQLAWPVDRAEALPIFWHADWAGDTAKGGSSIRTREVLEEDPMPLSKQLLMAFALTGSTLMAASTSAAVCQPVIAAEDQVWDFPRPTKA